MGHKLGRWGGSAPCARTHGWAFTGDCGVVAAGSMDGLAGLGGWLARSGPRFRPGCEPPGAEGLAFRQWDEPGSARLGITDMMAGL
jgi:hypothetical protein